MIRGTMILELLFAATNGHAGEPAFTWSTGCGLPIGEDPAFVDNASVDEPADGECTRITGEESGYQDGFSPIMAGHQLLLIATGQVFSAGIHEAEATAELRVPRCSACDGYCAETAGTETTRTVQRIELEKEQRYLIVDLTTEELFPQWHLMGADIEVTLSGPGTEPTRTSISLKGWPWCA